MILEASGLSFRYSTLPVFDGVEIRITPGITAIIGPNAAGKSTLLKCLCGQLKPRGQVQLDEQTLQSLPASTVSRLISYLPQEFAPQAALTVFETVLLGRLHDLGWRVTADDTDRVEHLLKEMNLTDLAGRYINELSGGQAQMVAIAQALIREPAVLLMDEPTANLDLRRQFEVCALIQQLTASRGISTAMAMHDLNLAARFADNIYVLHHGGVRCSGPPATVLTAEMIAAVYQVDARVTPDEEGRPLITVRGPCFAKLDSINMA